MSVSDHTSSNLVLASWIYKPTQTPTQPHPRSSRFPSLKIDLLKPLRRWLDNINVNDAKLAHAICQKVPSQCPFERDVKLFGRTLLHIPPLCKLNPLYDEIVSLRFRALCYLADECGEDVTQYC